MSAVDPLELGRALIRCPSVTPADAGALDVLQAAAEAVGFVCRRLRFESPGTPAVDNLYARLGSSPPNFCFAGHTDVVPPGDPALWSVDPFGGEVRDGRLWGRGACDMKPAIACFLAAADRFAAAHPAGSMPGSISLLITGDEEGPSINGTAKVLPWLAERGEVLAACLVGEPTNRLTLGETIKIGRRGSLNVELVVHGVQGHTAYPERADNPLSRLVRLLAELDAAPLDDGSDPFPPSSLALTSIDVGNPATNVIPARATARLNVRFNDRHSGESLVRWLRDRCAAVGGRIDLDAVCTAEPFLCPPGRLSGAVAQAVREVTGRTPELGTSGGTSDARFIARVCPTCEFGLPGETAHKVDESVALADIEALTRVYARVLDRYFAPEPDAGGC